MLFRITTAYTKYFNIEDISVLLTSMCFTWYSQ